MKTLLITILVLFCTISAKTQVQDSDPTQKEDYSQYQPAPATLKEKTASVSENSQAAPIKRKNLFKESIKDFGNRIATGTKSMFSSCGSIIILAIEGAVVSAVIILVSTITTGGSVSL